MGELVNDEILEAFAIVGTPDEIVPRLMSRYGDVVDRVTLTFGFGAKASSQELIAKLHG